MIGEKSSQAAELRRSVAAVFADVLHVKVPSQDTDLLASGLLDSLGFVELLVALEQRFGIRIEMQSLEPDNFRSIEEIAAFVADWQRTS